MVTKQELNVGELVIIRDYSYALRLGIDECTNKGCYEPNAQQQLKVLVTNCDIPILYKLPGDFRNANTIVMGQVDNVVWLVHSGLVEKVQPPHVWRHGDVFEINKNIMVYMSPIYVDKPQVFYLRKDTDAICDVDSYLKHAKFLFNIKDKL